MFYLFDPVAPQLEAIPSMSKML